MYPFFIEGGFIGRFFKKTNFVFTLYDLIY